MAQKSILRVRYKSLQNRRIEARKTRPRKRLRRTPTHPLLRLQVLRSPAITPANAEALPAAGKKRKTRPSMPVIPAFSSVEVRLTEKEKEIKALRSDMEKLERLRKRDEDLLRQLCLLLIEKNLVTKDEILKRMNRAG